MIHLSSIQPDVELRDYLQGQISVGISGGGTAPVQVYGDWEKPTNDVPDDFFVIFTNGDVGGVGMKADYADGFLIVSLFCRLNDNGSVRKNRIKKILDQFDNLVEENVVTKNYYYAYDASRFITPTTPNQSSGYSVTSLNIKWHTTENFNKTS